MPGQVPGGSCGFGAGVDVVRRALVRLREEAIFVGLWAMVACAASGLSLLAAAIAHH